LGELAEGDPHGRRRGIREDHAGFNVALEANGRNSEAQPRAVEAGTLELGEEARGRVWVYLLREGDLCQPSSDNLGLDDAAVMKQLGRRVA